MISRNCENNVNLIGTLVEPFTPMAESDYGARVLKSTIEVKRLSGKVDILPIQVWADVVEGKELSRVEIIGEFRSHNITEDGARRHLLNVWVKEINPAPEDVEDKNEIVFDGYICKQPVYRLVPSGYGITDVHIAINRAYKSDYIPCIAWNDNAGKLADSEIGTHVSVSGRIQSREYTKDGITRTAYEVSINEYSELEDSNEQSN